MLAPSCKICSLPRNETPECQHLDLSNCSHIHPAPHTAPRPPDSFIFYAKNLMSSKNHPSGSSQAQGKRAAGDSKHVGSENTSPCGAESSFSQHTAQGFKPWVHNPADITLFNPRSQWQKFDRSVKYSTQWEPSVPPEQDRKGRE